MRFSRALAAAGVTMALSAVAAPGPAAAAPAAAPERPMTGTHLAGTADGAIDARATVFIIRNHSGKCLEIENSSKRNGARAQQWTCNGQDGAKWRFVETSGDRLYIVNARSGKCLEIENSSRRNGARAQQWTCNSQAGSLWS
ncbi:RICIN domain-containing protein [Streptomyces tricolor]